MWHVDDELYMPMALESFNSEYPAYIDTLIARPKTYFNGYSEFEIKKPLCWSIPPEIIEFIKNCSVITKLGAFQLHIELRVPKYIYETIVFYLWDQFKMQNIKTVNYLEWILFMSEDKPFMNALFYFNCNPHSEYYGKIMVYHTDMHYTSHNTMHMQIITFQKFMSSITSWMLVSCQNTRNGSAELMVIRAVNFLDSIYDDVTDSEVTDNEVTDDDNEVTDSEVTDSDNNKVTDNDNDKFPEDFTIRDILNTDRKTDRIIYIVNELHDHLMTKLVHPAYGTLDPEAVVASFTYFLFQDRI